jgi:hypothetical protein
MSKEAQLNLGSNSDWEAEHLRLTCFVLGATRTDQNWWEQICGSPPESSTTRLKGAHRVDQGKFGSGVFSVEVQPGRVDLVLSPFVDPQTPIIGLPTLGPFQKALIEFEGIANQWFKLEELPDVQRVALGTPVLMSIDSLKTGYLRLAGYLRDLKVDPNNSSDLSYQINRPRKSLTKIPSLNINRLSKWSVARLRVYAPQSDIVRALTEERYFCRLELDINTVPEQREPLPKDMLPALFSELASLASEIMLKGDIA